MMLGTAVAAIALPYQFNPGEIDVTQQKVITQAIEQGIT
jgi:hypothetical protein